MLAVFRFSAHSYHTKCHISISFSGNQTFRFAASFYLMEFSSKVPNQSLMIQVLWNVMSVGDSCTVEQIMDALDAGTGWIFERCSNAER